MAKIELKNEEALDDSLIVCKCNEVQLGEMYRTLSNNPNLSFDRLLRTSKLADRCTACLLDLEYYYIQLPRDDATAPVVDGGASIKSKIPFRRKIYQLVDKLSPMRAMRLTNHVPVLVGENIQQWLWMANYQLDYDEPRDITDFDIHLLMYDEDGHCVWRDTRLLRAGSEWREELTQYIPERALGKAAGEAMLSVFWLGVTRYAKSDGVRGTTRPQIEIVTPSSSCAVHGQAAGLNNGRFFDLNYCPDEDRVFVSIINIGRKALRLEMRYPEDPLQRLTLPARSTEVVVPANGIKLHQVVLNETERAAFRNKLFRFSWHGFGEYKAHVIVASRDLDRFSIDHA